MRALRRAQSATRVYCGNARGTTAPLSSHFPLETSHIRAVCCSAQGYLDTAHVLSRSSDSSPFSCPPLQSIHNEKGVRSRHSSSFGTLGAPLHNEKVGAAAFQISEYVVVHCMGLSVLRLTLAERVAACAVCFAVGAALLFAVGFAHSTTLHNAAHDVRHTFVFPCH